MSGPFFSGLRATMLTAEEGVRLAVEQGQIGFDESDERPVLAVADTGADDDLVEVFRGNGVHVFDLASVTVWPERSTRSLMVLQMVSVWPSTVE